jgi:hypothetical protein
VIKITGKNIMNQITGKAALLALSIISASAYASHWSYEGDGAPEHWGELDDTYKTCQSGARIHQKHGLARADLHRPLAARRFSLAKM